MLAAVVLVSSAHAQPKPDFAQDVRPILESRCFACHGSKLQMHGLRLDHRADALKGGGSGVPAIVPGASAQSLLIKYVAGLDKDVVMPPAGPRLKPAEVAALRAWIDAGAPWPGEAEAQPVSKRSEHWAFQPIVRPRIPDVKSPWVHNPIDAFVLEKLQARGWTPAPPAEPRALLRRVYLDLNGLPPTLAEQEAFLKDPAQLEHLVDDLLARPAYGERWARHWLDLVRYAESNGYERDGTKPQAWRYRDYVIQAFMGISRSTASSSSRSPAMSCPMPRPKLSSPLAITASAPGTMSPPTPKRTASISSMTWSAPRRKPSSG